MENTGCYCFTHPQISIIERMGLCGYLLQIAGALYSHIASADTFKLMLRSILYLVLIAVSWDFRPADRKIIFNNK